MLIWRDVVYLTEESYCYMSLDRPRSVLLAFLVMYGIAASLLALIYLRITIYVQRESSNLQPIAMRRQQQRDIVVIQRIILTAGLVIFAGIPATILLLIKYITGEQQPLFFRINWLTSVISLVQLNVSILLLTPHLKRIVFQKIQPIRIHPLILPLTRSTAIPNNTARM
ncbi:unnamed protein product [Adineta ricciae]|uniref:G-protein coupled receptors family 1 profile domain-containing protein n=1 Tax=Adineta ricciae TaxID=249248 RepID=A0A814QLA7_ADIRI|nr:unnamed protein product [Adineta ricciae]CAF1355355.1 unnamed protein product [Adineta ricciae]